ncbi:MAG TPA: SRPBCC family protein [Solirubrobacteraceae bacterium]
MVELDQPFTTDRPLEDSWGLVLDLERLVPCVQGGSVTEMTSDDSVKAEIKVKMGAMSMKFTGTVSIVEQDAEAHRALLRVKAREAGGSGHANADVVFTLQNGGGNVHTSAQITGKAASMGEGMVSTVLEAMIKDFTEKFAAAV